jgi:hypothetical protein
MKKLIFISFMLALFFSACEHDRSEEIIPGGDNVVISDQYISLMKPYQADPALLKTAHNRNGNSVERPIYFRAEGILYGESNEAVCGTAPMMVVEGEGTGSHVGNFKVRLSYCDGTGYPPTGKITAASRDEIKVMMIKQDIDPEKGYYQSYLIFDGSGRFSGATGAYTLYGSVDETTGSWKLEGGGMISY